jgi:prepilin-type processing-associated H-X9-DG protein
VRLYPFLEQQSLFDVANKTTGNGTWRESGNFSDASSPYKTIRQTAVAVLSCPSQGPFKANSNATAACDAFHCGNYVANMGNTDAGHHDTLWDGTARKFLGAPFGIGYYTNESSGTGSGYVHFISVLSDIQDGTSHTFAFSEYLHPDKDDGKCGTTSYTWFGQLGSVVSAGGSGFTTHFPPNSKNDYTSRLCPQSIGIRDYNCAVVETQYAWTRTATRTTHTARSNHSGGVNVGLLDGSVRFVSETIDIDVWRAASTTKGTESLSLP